MLVFIRFKYGKTALRRYTRKGNVWLHVEPEKLQYVQVTVKEPCDSVYVRKMFPKKDESE